MAQTTIIRADDTTEGQHFEGIGPYSQKTFRLAAAPAASPDASILPPIQMAPKPSRVFEDIKALERSKVFQDIEALERQVCISTRWYDVGGALLILVSSGAALYRLMWMGQP